MLSCTFIGHRQVLQGDVEKRLLAKLEELMEMDEAFEFYMGRNGEFDDICRRAGGRIKERHPEKRIIRVLVEPYMKQSLNADKILVNRSYDEIIVPEELIDVHYKRAITARNFWMIDMCQYLIAYVHRDFGGAWTAMQYAKERGLTICNLAEELPLIAG